MLVRMRSRRLAVLIALAGAILLAPISANANPDAIQSLYKKALRDSAVRIKLITAGVLNASSDIVASNQLKDAATLFVETYAPDVTGDGAVMARLDSIVSQYNTFTNLRDSNYENEVVIKIPARLLATLKNISRRVETLHISGDGSWALRYGTYRYPLKAQTPQSLLREIFYRNENLVVESMQSDENGFQVSGFVRNPEGTIERHFLRKAFQVGGSTTAIYMQYAHTAPADFEGPSFIAPYLDRIMPPQADFEIEDSDQRLEKLQEWVEQTYTEVLTRTHPPESVTAIRRFQTVLPEKIAEWREEQRDELRRRIFEVAVPEDLEERLRRFEKWRRDEAWRLIVRTATNISAAYFDNNNGWKNIDVDNCQASFKSNSENTDYQEVRIIFATNRARGLELLKKDPRGERFNIKRLFKNETDPDDNLHYGCVYVTVPMDPKAEKRRETHVYEDWGWRERVRDTDLKTYYSIRRYAYLGNSGDNPRGERVRLIDRERRFAEREHMALLYVHGYNTAFHESLLRIAQIAAASRYPGRIYLFSWPSARSASSYVADMDASEKSDPYLAAFVQSILLDSKIKLLDVLAHSMGGQVFLRAFSRFRSSFDQVKQVRFGKVIFAAPDVSQTVFKEKINDIVPYTIGQPGVSVYASSLDRVLLLSSFLRGGKPRAGDLSRDTILDREVVNVVNATRPAWWCDPTQYSFLGHTYFSNNDEVLRHIIAHLKPTWKRAPGETVRRYSAKHECWYETADEASAKQE